MNLFRILFASGLLLFFLNAATPQDLQKGLVGHWTFDEGAGKELKDHSSFGNHGTVKGDPEWKKGIVGSGALAFDGEGDHIQILQNGGTPKHLRELGKGSISIWFRARNIPVGESILPVLYYGNKNGCENMFDASNEGLIIEVAHGKVFRRSQGVFYTVFSNHCDYPSFCFDSHSDAHLNDLKGKIREGAWNHFVVVVGKDYNTAYLNGSEMTFRQYNFNGPKASQFFADALKHERMWLGKGYWDHASEVYFDGSMDDLRIYDRPLGEEEVKDLYAMGKEGSG